MNSFILALMLSLAPNRPVYRLDPIARAIATVAVDQEDVALLVTTSFYETTFGRKGIPFGISCCYRPGMGLRQSAQIALRILHTSKRVCGGTAAGVFARYRLGRCRAQAHDFKRARTYNRLLLNRTTAWL